MNKNFNKKSIYPIAYIKTDFDSKFGLPRQSGRVPNLLGEIVFVPKFNNINYVKGLEDFSHLWLIFGFSLVNASHAKATVRPPRLGGNKRVGVFATRSPFRPNTLGLSSVKIEKISNTNKGLTILVSGIDLVNDTPIYDIKPYLPTCDCHVQAKGSFAQTENHHQIRVECLDEVLQVLPPEKRTALLDCIKDDPRPSYQDDNREYKLTYAGYNVRFYVQENTATIISIEKE